MRLAVFGLLWIMAPAVASSLATGHDGEGEIKLQPSPAKQQASSVSVRFDIETIPMEAWIGLEPTKLTNEWESIQDIYSQLTMEERSQLTDPTQVVRHLRAEKGDVQLGLKKLRDALQFLQEFGADDIKDDSNEEMRAMLGEENASGKIYVRGYDAEGRALMYMRPARENTHHEDNNMRHLVWNLEKAIACTARESVKRGSEYPLEKINLVIDYAGFKLRESPPMSTAKRTLDILQKYYPERLHRAYVIHPPFIFRTFWTMIRPFIDPLTKQKIVFCTGKQGLDTVREDVGDLSKLEPMAGGECTREFDPTVYVKLPLNVSFDED